jgi:hypothetical protein
LPGGRIFYILLDKNINRIVFFAEKKQVAGLVIRGSSRRSRTRIRGVIGCLSISVSVTGVLEYFPAVVTLDLVVLLTLVIAFFCVFVFGALCTGRNKQLRSSVG